MTVLLIEPEIYSAELYTEALRAINANVRHVGSSQDALDALDSNLPDCIVLELDIRSHNGFEFLYEFCSQEDWAGVPIVIHTSILPDRLTSMLVKWEEFNVSEFLYKPQSTLKDLQDSVKAAIGARDK